MYSDYSCVAILIRSNDIEVHGTGKGWYCTTRLLTPHTNLLNFAFHRTISRVGISYCLTSSAEPLLDIPPPSSNCCALMRSLASWGIMRERSDLVKKSSYCAGSFQDWNWLWHKPGKIILNEIMLLAGVGFSIAAHCITFHHLFKVECGWCKFQDLWNVSTTSPWTSGEANTQRRMAHYLLFGVSCCAYVLRYWISIAD